MNSNTKLVDAARRAVRDLGHFNGTEQLAAALSAVRALGDALAAKPEVSAACVGEKCYCGAPAAKKVGEEILFDDPNPDRHNLTSYICARHYAELMGPVGARQIGIDPTALSSSDTTENDNDRA